MYGIIYSTLARVEWENIEAYHFNSKRAQMHDPMGIVAKTQDIGEDILPLPTSRE
jgi:hypothetical protein